MTDDKCKELFGEPSVKAVITQKVVIERYFFSNFISNMDFIQFIHKQNRISTF